MDVLSSARISVILAFGAIISANGCSTLSTKVDNCLKNYMEQRQLRSEIHQAKYEQRQAEKKYQRDCIRAEIEKYKNDMQAQFNQNLKSQLSVDLAQQIQFSEIKLDAEKMKAMIADAEKADAEAQSALDEQQEERLKNYKEQLRQYAVSQMQYEEAQAKMANDCGQPAENDCCRPAPPCKPTFPVLPAQSRPLQKDLALSSIPLKAEIRINMNSTNPRIEQARNQSLPSEKAIAAAKKSCGNCGTCDACTRTAHIDSCYRSSTGVPPAPPSLSDVEVPTPP